MCVKKTKFRNKATMNPLNPKEEKEIMKDILLSNITLYSPKEIAQAIKEGIVSYEEVEEVLTPSNG